MGQAPLLLLIGDGRLARHLKRYFEQLGLEHRAWSRRSAAEQKCPPLKECLTPGTHALLAVSDSAIEALIAEHPEFEQTVRVHFSGSRVTPLAYGAHPLFSFASTLYERELYERIPFVLDVDAPPLSELIPGLPNPSARIEPAQRARYHALCVLAGNFTTLLWRKFFFELDWELGLPREQAFPYLESITRALQSQGAPLSGPLARGDQETIQKNLEALAGDPFEQVYRSFLAAYSSQAAHQAPDGKDWLQP